MKGLWFIVGSKSLTRMLNIPIPRGEVKIWLHFTSTKQALERLHPVPGMGVISECGVISSILFNRIFEYQILFHFHLLKRLDKCCRHHMYWNFGIGKGVYHILFSCKPRILPKYFNPCFGTINQHILPNKKRDSEDNGYNGLPFKNCVVSLNNSDVIENQNSDFIFWLSNFFENFRNYPDFCTKITKLPHTLHIL